MKKVLIIGLGLMGGSLAVALKSRIDGIKICCVENDENSAQEAKKTGIIEDFVQIDAGIVDFDLIVIATPLKSYGDVLEKIAKFEPKNSLIIDLGSLKNFVFKAVPDNIKKNFIACHPIAGKEKSGFENAEQDLFVDKKFVICKNKLNSDENLQEIAKMAELIGSEVEFMDPQTHDKIFALVSHLPQFLSFLTKEFEPKKLERDFLQRSFRLNNSNAQIWGDIFEMNQENIEDYYVEFFDNLIDLAEELEEGNFEGLIEEMQKSAKILQNDGENFGLKGVSPCSEDLFRLLIVAAFLNIKDIKNHAKYAGSGFKDFTLIINLLKLPKETLVNSLVKSEENILDSINKISS